MLSVHIIVLETLKYFIKSNFQFIAATSTMYNRLLTLGNPWIYMYLRSVTTLSQIYVMLVLRKAESLCGNSSVFVPSEIGSIAFRFGFLINGLLNIPWPAILLTELNSIFLRLKI